MKKELVKSCVSYVLETPDHKFLTRNTGNGGYWMYEAKEWKDVDLNNLIFMNIDEITAFIKLSTFVCDYRKRDLIPRMINLNLSSVEPVKTQILSNAEQAKGRSPHYHTLYPRDQWAEDKGLGILDWDGK